MLIRIRIEHPRVQIAEVRMLSAIDSIVYRLKVAEPHILVSTYLYSLVLVICSTVSEFILILVVLRMVSPTLH